MFTWNRIGPLNFRNEAAYYALLFFAISTAIIHQLLSRAAKKSAQVFVRSFMAITTFKILAYLLFIVVYLLNRPPGGKVFVLHFLMLYFIFTAFETYQLFKNKTQ